MLRLSIGSSYGGWWTVREKRGARDGEQSRDEGEKGRTQPAAKREARGRRWTVGALMNQFKCMR